MTAKCLPLNEASPPKKKTLVKILLWLAAASVLWAFRGPILDLVKIAGDRDALVGYMQVYGASGPVLIYLILTLQVIVAAVPGHLVMLVSGYLYGFALAFAVTHVSTVLASQFAYWLARRYGRPVVARLAPEDVVEKWTGKAERQGMVFFFWAFTLPIFPSDVMNFVAGLSGLSSRKFFVANFVGRLPTSLIFSLIGAQGFRITPALGIAAAVYTVLMLIAWRAVTPMLEGRARAAALEQGS